MGHIYILAASNEQLFEYLVFECSVLIFCLFLGLFSSANDFVIYYN